MQSFEFTFPGHYVQGQDVILEIKRLLFPYGSRFVFIMGCGPITDDVKSKIKQSFENPCVDNVQEKHPVRRARLLQAAEAIDQANKKMEYEFIDQEGLQVTVENIAALAEKIKATGAEVVVGVGGGKALDFCRGAAQQCGLPTVLVPTAAATNAPGTRLHVIYNEEGETVNFGLSKEYSKLIVADLNLMIGAPADSIAAGIGDCIGTYYEGCATAKEFNTRDFTSTMGWAVFDMGGKVLREKGVSAYRAAQAHVVSNDYAQVVEHLIYANGVYSACVGGINLCHILDDVLLKFPPVRKFAHGHVIGYSVLPLWVKNSHPLQEIYDYIDFAKQLGFPVTMKDLGIENATRTELYEAAAHALNSPTFRLTPVKLTVEDMYENILVANEIAVNYLAKK